MINRKWKRDIVFTLIIFAGVISLAAQEASELEKHIAIEYKSSINQLIRRIEENSQVRIHFSPAHINSKTEITIPEKQLTVRSLINHIADNQRLTSIINGHDVFLIRNITRQQKISADISLSGYIRDIDTGEALEGAAVYTKDPHSGLITDHRGYFNIKIPPEADTVIISYVGYQPIVISRSNFGSGILGDHYLKSAALLQEVLIYDTLDELDPGLPDFQRHKTSARLQGNNAKLGINDAFGELIVKPGIQKINDFQGGLSVNGSSPGTNIYYLDGIRVFEPNHLFGLFSSFSSKPISSVTIHTNSIPLNYSGAYTSVLDFHTRDGNFRKTETEAGLSNSAAHLFITGPIKKYRTSYFIDYRHSLIGAYLPAFIKKYKDIEFGRISFNDLHAKITHSISPANRISLFYYQGNDNIGITSSSDQNIDSDNEFKWANTAAGLHWHMLAGDNLRSELSISLAGYKNHSYSSFKIPESDSDDRFLSIYSGTYNREYSLKQNFGFYKNRSVIRSGYQLARLSVSPVLGSAISTTENEKISFESDRDSVLNNAMAYISAEFNPNSKIKLQAGIQAGILYKSPFSKKYANPQISIAFKPTDNAYLDFAYNRTNMFLHSLGSYAAGIPSMIWVLSDSKIPVASSDVISMNAIYRSKRITVRAEIYGRLMHDILFYKNIIDSYNPIASRNAFIPLLSDTDSPDDNIETGKGKSYGFNIMAELKLNKLNASISFSSNRAFEKYDALNRGKWFPGKFDLYYSAGASMSYNYEKFRFFLDINSHSGQHFTLPLYHYTGIDGEEILDFSNIHNIRIGRYLSVDAGADYSAVREKYRWKISWGITNAFNHFNPAYAYIYKKNDLYRTSRVGGLPLIPFIAAEIGF